MLRDRFAGRNHVRRFFRGNTTELSHIHQTASRETICVLALQDVASDRAGGRGARLLDVTAEKTDMLRFRPRPMAGDRFSENGDVFMNTKAPPAELGSVGGRSRP
jgi:hypothetical protein